MKNINPHKLYLSIIFILLICMFILSDKTFVSNNNGIFMIGVNYGGIETAIKENF